MSKTLKKSLVLVMLVLAILLLWGTKVNAETISDEFKSYLNDDGKFEMNSAIPTDDDYFAFMVDLVSYDEDKWLGLMFTNVASDYSEVDLTINAYEENEETHRVKIQWNYNEAANEKIQNFLETTLKDKTEFNVKDLELVNYWYNNIKNNYRAELVMYSGELKTLLNYGNIEFNVSTRGGGNPPFKSEAIGFAYFGYDGSIYHVIDDYGATGDHFLYVPTETENTPEAIGAAAQKRIDDYLGENDLEVCYLSTAWEFWVNHHYESTREEWQTQEGYGLTIEEFEQLGNIYIPPYNSFEEGFEAVFGGTAGVHEDDLIYELVIPIDENMGDGQYVIIRRDSSKMVTPVSRTADLSTKIEISTEETLPLDTIIQAKELTSGTEYERIVKLLNLTDNLTFDLKLYSNSLDRYVTQLTDGSFEVQIPIPEDFKGKELYVYYVGNSNEPEIFTVNIADGYAVFTTNHFSTYTLGYKDTVTPIKITFDANGGKFGKETTYTINAWEAELYDTLEIPTRDGYTFKGYYTEKTGGTKFEMILNEAGIDSNSIFYAQWEENSGKGEAVVSPDNKDTVSGNNPQTSDNIIFFVLMLFIAVLGITVTTKFRNR